MEENLKKDIAAVVAEIFSQKEESEVRKQTEEALQTSASTIDELTTTLEAKNIELEEQSTKVSSLEETQAELNQKLEAAGEEKAEVETKLEEATQALEAIAKESVTKARMAELESAGVVRKDAEAQAAKVGEMSDEDFTSYKEELEAVKASIVETMEKAAADADADAAAVAAAAATAADDDSGENASDDSDDGVTPPAEVNPAIATAAAMNLEVASVSDDLAAKYADLGKALAKQYESK